MNKYDDAIDIYTTLIESKKRLLGDKTDTLVTPLKHLGLIKV